MPEFNRDLGWLGSDGEDDELDCPSWNPCEDPDDDEDDILDAILNNHGRRIEALEETVTNSSKIGPVFWVLIGWVVATISYRILR